MDAASFVFVPPVAGSCCSSKTFVPRSSTRVTAVVVVSMARFIFFYSIVE